jgi:DNA-binding CsgD family transcriptional regulator
MRQETVLALIDRVYAAGLDAAEWPRFLQALSDALAGNGAGLTFARRDGGADIHTGVGIWGPEFRAEYRLFASCDPWVSRAVERGMMRAGTVGIGEALLPMAELERTRFFNDFGRRHDYVGGVSSIVLGAGTGLAAVSVCRPRNRSFGQAEVDLMRVLLPHLARALRVHTRLAESDAREKGLCHALDRMVTGALLVAKGGAVAFMNESARETLADADGLTVDRHGLRAGRPLDTARLRTAIAAAATGDSNALPGCVLLVERPSGRRSLQVIVSPFVGSDALGEPRGQAIVFVTDPERLPEPDLALLNRVHGLSRAEADVARLLLRDLTAREIAHLLSVSVNTVRFHLKQLFSKTGARRQSELVRLLLHTTHVRRG